MGDTQSAQREDKQDAAVEQQQQQQQQPEEEEKRGEVDDAQTEQIVEAKNSKNGGPINGTADHSLVDVNGHREDEIVSQVIVLTEEDILETEKPLKEAQSEVEADEDVQLEIIEMNAKRNDINKSFQRFFSNIGLKVTVKKGSGEQEENVEEPNLTGDSEAVEKTSSNDAPENCDSTTFFCLQDAMPEDVIEKAEKMATASKEEVECENTDAEIILFVENQQHELTAEEEPHSTSPVSPEDEVVQSPIKKFFSTGIFSGLRKKKKLAEHDTARKEAEEEGGAKGKIEALEITEQNIQDQEQDPEAVSPAEVETQEKEEVATIEISDERKMSVETDISSPQEKEKVQASPLKMFLSGSSLKRKPQRSRRSSDARLSDSGEHVLDQSPSPQPMENHKDTIATTDVPKDAPKEAPKEEESAWASFIKLMTPKKRIKKSSTANEESQVPCAEEETKQKEREQLSDHSTEEGRKRKDSLVSWEAVLCGSGRRKSRKTSDSEDETPQADSGSKSCTLERNKRAESPYDSEPGSAWNSLKRMVTPKRKSKDEHEPLKDNAQSDNELPQDDSSVSINNLQPGNKKSKSDETEVGVPSDEANKYVASDDEDSETPAVVPLSEYGMEETDICIQTESIVESQSTVDKDKQLQEDLHGELTPLATPLVPKEPVGAEEPDDISESISEHHLLSDIPEEGIITETMATPVLALEEVATDETMAEEPVEITSEAITAPEPVTDITTEDETEMISAVSQLTSQSSKTSGNTTPVQANYDILETDKVLLQVVETISPSAQTDPLVAEEIMSQKIAGCVLQETYEAIEEKQHNVLELHRRSDATAFKTGLNVNEIEAISELAAESKRECISEMNGFIPTEVVPGVGGDKLDNATVSVDEIQKATVKQSEEINELEMRLPLVESPPETQALKDVSPEEDKIVVDTCAQDTAPHAETKIINSEEDCNATTATSENEDEGLKEEVRITELETPLNKKSPDDSCLDEGHAAETAIAKEKEATEMVEAMQSTTERKTVQSLAKEVELGVASLEEIEIVEDAPGKSMELLTKDTADIQNDGQNLPANTPDLEEVKDVKSLQDMSKSSQLRETVSDESKEEPNVINEVNLQLTSAMETEEIKVVEEPPQDMEEVHSQSTDKQETSTIILDKGKDDLEMIADTSEIVEEQEEVKIVQAQEGQEAKPRALSLGQTVEDEPSVTVKASEVEISQVDQNTKEGLDESFQKENIPEVKTLSEEPKEVDFKEEPTLKTVEQLKTPETVQDTEENSILSCEKKIQTDTRPEAETVANEAKEKQVLPTAVGHESVDISEHVQSPEVPHAVYDEGSAQSFKKEDTSEMIHQEDIPVEEHKEGSCTQLLPEENVVPEITSCTVKLEAVQETSLKEEEASNETNEKELEEKFPKQEFEETTADGTQTVTDVSSIDKEVELDQAVQTQSLPSDTGSPPSFEYEFISAEEAGEDIAKEQTLLISKENDELAEDSNTTQESNEEQVDPKAPSSASETDATHPSEEFAVHETSPTSEIITEVPEGATLLSHVTLVQEEAFKTVQEEVVEEVVEAKPEERLLEGEPNNILAETSEAPAMKDDEEDLVKAQTAVPETSPEPETVKEDPEVPVLSDVHLEQEEASENVQEAEVLQVEHKAAASSETSSPQLIAEVVTPESTQLDEAKPDETLFEGESKKTLDETSGVLQFNIVPEMEDVKEDIVHVQEDVPEASPESEAVTEEPKGTVLSDIQLEPKDASKTVQEAEVLHDKDEAAASPVVTSLELLEDVVAPESSQLVEEKPEEILLEEETNKMLAETSEVLQFNVVPEMEDVKEDTVQVQEAVPEISPEPETVTEEPEGTVLSDTHLEPKDASQTVQAEMLPVKNEEAASPVVTSLELLEDVVVAESSHLVEAVVEAKPEERLLEGETNNIFAETSEVPDMKDEEDIVKAQTAVLETSPEPETVTEETVLSDNQLEQEDTSKTVQESEALQVESKAAASSETGSQQLLEEVVAPDSSHLVEAKPEERLLDEETDKVLAETSEVLQFNVVPEMEDVKEDIVQVQEAVPEISPEPEAETEEPEGTVLSDIHLEPEDASQTVQEAEVLDDEHKAATSSEVASPQLLEEVVTPEGSQLDEAKPEEERPLDEEANKLLVETSEVPDMKDDEEDIVKAQTAVSETSPEPETVTEEPDETVVSDNQLEQEEASKTVQEAEELHCEHEVVASPVVTSPQLLEDAVKPESSNLVEAKPDETMLEGEPNNILAETSEVPDMKEDEEGIVKAQTAVPETSPEPETVTEKPEGTVQQEEQEEASKTVQEAEELHCKHEVVASPVVTSPQLLEEVVKPESSNLVEAKPEETLLEGEPNNILAETSEVPDMKDDEEDIVKAQTAVPETSPEPETVTEKPEGSVQQEEQEEASKTVQEAEESQVEHKAAACSETSSPQLIAEVLTPESSQSVEAKPDETPLEEETNTIPAETAEVTQYNVTTETKDVEEESVVQVQEVMECVETEGSQNNEKEDISEVDNKIVNGFSDPVPQNAQTEQETSIIEIVEEFHSLTAECVPSVIMESYNVEKPAVHKETTPPDPTNATLTDEQQQQVTVAASQTTDKQEKEGQLTDVETKKAQVSDEPQQQVQLVAIQDRVEQEKEAEMPFTEIKTVAVTDEPEQMVQVSVAQVSREQEKESELQGTQVETVSLEHAIVTQVVTCEIKESLVTLPDVLMEETSEISEPMIETKIPEQEFTEQMETLVPLPKEEVPEASAKENDVVVMVKAPSVRREDDHRIQVQTFSADLKSAETNVDSVLTVGVTDSREIIEVCGDALEKVDYASAKAEMEEEAVTQEKEVTVEEVIQHELEDQEEAEDDLDLDEEKLDVPDVVRRLSKSAESEQSEFEYDTAGEESQDESIPLTCDTTEQQLPTEVEQESEYQESSERQVCHSEAEAIATVEQEISKESVPAPVPNLTCETSGLAEGQEPENTMQTSQSSTPSSHCTEVVLPANSGIILSRGNVESMPSLSVEVKLNIQFGQPKGPESPPPPTVITSSVQQINRADVGLKAEEPGEPTKTLVQVRESQEQEASEVSASSDASDQKSETAEAEDQPEPADSATSDVQATDITEPDSAAELQEPPFTQRAKPDEPTEQTEEEPDQDEWMDAEEVIVATKEETDALFSDVEETLEPPAPCEHEDEATPEHDAETLADSKTNQEVFELEMGETGDACEVDSEGEDFAAALEDLKKENPSDALTKQD